MLCLMLERMELSRGFNNLEKRTNRPHTSKITLLPKKQVIENLTAAKNSVGGGKQQRAQPAIASVLQQAQRAQPANAAVSGPLEAVQLSSRPPNSNNTKGNRPTSASAAGRAAANASSKDGGPKYSDRDARLNKLGEILEGNRERLNRIFTYYCSFGEPLNTNKMRSSKFIKLLKDAKLLEPSQQGQTGPQTPSHFKRNPGSQSIFNVDDQPHQPLRR